MEPRVDAEQIASKRPSIASRALIGVVRFYQRYISALKGGPTCRFDPSCSAYALTALRRWGVCRGVVLTLVRLSKCGPWHPGGYDPVPLREGGVVDQSVDREL